MSLQDDLFDVSAALEGKPEIEAFERGEHFLHRIKRGDFKELLE